MLKADPLAGRTGEAQQPQHHPVTVGPPLRLGFRSYLLFLAGRYFLPPTFLVADGAEGVGTLCPAHFQSSQAASVCVCTEGGARVCHVSAPRTGRRRPGSPRDLLGLAAQGVGRAVCARDRKGCAGLQPAERSCLG